MKLTNRDIWEARGALQLAVNLSPPPLVAVSMKLARNCRKANAKLEDINAVLKSLAQEYEVDVEKPGRDGHTEMVREIPEARREAYNGEVEELLSQEVEVDVRVISAEDLTHCEAKREGFVMPPGILFGAWWMFED